MYIRTTAKIAEVVQIQHIVGSNATKPFRLASHRNLPDLKPCNFWILFKLIKSLIILVSSKLQYASFTYKITSVLNLIKLITST